MNGTASAAQWLTCSGIGCGTGAVVLGLIKLALDTESTAARGRQEDRYPAYQPPPALPARAPQSLRWHAAPSLLAETQPIRVQTSHARHARHTKKAA
ncbi:hypothetical protein [Streptomyces sp. NPDC005799]|uniref:hypothetical protein n=1 Tax=Streptomyces sp. NPDC005799 TaxID=3154678 RepID=UPI0033D56828